MTNFLLPPTPPDPAWVEREYNNRERVPEHPALFARWERDSAFVRRTLPGHLDLAYGPDPRHRIDLFPAPGSDRLLVFLHGGYWRSLDKALFSWLAPAWVAEGVSVALPNYRLCPAVAIADIVEDAIAAVNWLAQHAPGHGAGAARIVVAGHSAGGHLAAALLAAAPGRLAFDTARIAGAVPVSGVFDFSPLPSFSGNADLRLDAASARALDLHDRRPTLAAPLVVAVGGDESGEFVRQSRLLAQRWSAQVRELQVLPALNHFTILDALAERGQPLHAATARLFG
jgi:arylformamidase